MQRSYRAMPGAAGQGDRLHERFVSGPLRHLRDGTPLLRTETRHTETCGGNG